MRDAYVLSEAKAVSAELKACIMFYSPALGRLDLSLINVLIASVLVAGSHLQKMMEHMIYDWLKSEHFIRIGMVFCTYRVMTIKLPHFRQRALQIQVDDLSPTSQTERPVYHSRYGANCNVM